MVDERVRHVLVRADIHSYDLAGLDVVLQDQAQHFGHGGMAERTRWKRLDGNSRTGEGAGVSQLILNRVWIPAATGCFKEAAGRFQDFVACGPADGCEVGGDYSRLSRT